MKDNNYVNKLLKRKQNSSSAPKYSQLTLDTLKKFDVDLVKIQAEVAFLDFGIIDYEEKSGLSVFGEKKVISYLLSFVIYNVEFQAKLMTFEYNTRSELLKLDLACKTFNVEKEMKYCCNSLQRRRNLNLMFLTLIKFTRYLESRRIICDIISKKDPNIETEENKDGGKIIIYSNSTKCIKLGVFWNVECNSHHEVVDKVEAYYKVEELSNRDDIRNTLTQLTEPFLEFNEKYHLWARLLELLSKDSSIVHVDCACPSFNVGANGPESSTLEGISIIRHPYLTSDRYKIKVEKEEPIDDDEIDVISSAECLPSKSSRCTSLFTSALDNKDLRLVVDDKEKLKDEYSNLNVYKGLLKDQSFMKNKSSSKESSTPLEILLCKSDRISKSPNLLRNPYNLVGRDTNQSSSDCTIVSIVSSNKTGNASISISDSDLNNVILLPSNNEVTSTSSRKRNGCTCHNSNKQQSIVIVPDDSNTKDKAMVVEIDPSPPKKYKITDDDLEITSVTYLIPD